MSTDKFSWKGLFVNEVETEDNSSEIATNAPVERNVTFSDSIKPNSKFPDASHSTSKVTVSQSVLDSIVAMYESGFESLNQPGYDFYEFFKAIESVGSKEPQVYKMAFTMAQTVDKKVTKEMLLEKAAFYITEIDKVHDHYLAQGNAKKNQIQTDQKNSKTLLNSEISDLEKSLIEIKDQIAKKSLELQSVDANMIAEVSEIDQKLTCNSIAKSKIEDAIFTVVNGIKNNL